MPNYLQSLMTPLVTIHADAMCSDESGPGQGGWAAVLRYGDRTREIYGVESGLPIGDLHILAVVNGLEALTRPVQVCVHSPGACQAIEEPPTATPELLSRLAEQHERHDVAWIPDAAPSNHSDHDRARQLARRDKRVTADQIKPLLRHTIEEALDNFLAEQRKFLSEDTLENYESVLGFFRYSLNEYGQMDLFEEDEKRLFEDNYARPGGKTFCQIFGPERIPGAMGIFLSFYSTRKCIMPQGNLNAAGPAARRLANWLGIQSYGIPAVDVRRMLEDAEEFASAQRFRRKWNDLCEAGLEFDEPEVEENFAGSLRIGAVEPGVIHFEERYEDREQEDLSSALSLSVSVPREISDLARPGWGIYLEAILVEDRWLASEIGNIHLDGG
ncbi:hypothetical protein [Micromonospora sp. WMMD712]|uniref:hypothetical protein n=1 Tax=Micromonospora sp. WMMD712 TaxID=3016096 RepID=UPI00249B6F70|nr:hypothetical protein [Micromonospora sp. WMMD712]WFE59534.1 hypothetical protein O7633_22970 [Micromonospora sp. WMMD712]